jgi:hypothetical protein
MKINHEKNLVTAGGKENKTGSDQITQPNLLIAVG